MKKEERFTYRRRDKEAKKHKGFNQYGIISIFYDDMSTYEGSIIDRLGEYEDTRMSPAEIMAMQRENAMLRARLNEANRTQRMGGSANRIVQNTLATALNAIGGSLMKQALHLRMLEREELDDMVEFPAQMENGKHTRIPWEAD